MARKKESRDAEAIRISNEHKALREGILHHVHVWSALENTLSMLLREIIDPDPASLSAIPFAIYFSPPGFDARLKLIDNVIRCLSVESPRYLPITKHWDYIYKELDFARRKRNIVAHGSISTHYHKGRNEMRIASPIYDPSHMLRSRESNRLPGLSPSELDAVIQRTINVNAYIETLTSSLQQLREHGPSTLTQISLELEDQRKRVPGQS